jgi:hypothetical protein
MPPHAKKRKGRNAGVASGILPDVEGGILPAGKAPDITWSLEFPKAFRTACERSAGLEARLYGKLGCLPPRPLRPLRPLREENEI